MVDSLLNSIRSPMGYKGLYLRVTQEVVLGHPLNKHGVIAQGEWRIAKMPPDDLLRQSSKRSSYLFRHVKGKTFDECSQ